MVSEHGWDYNTKSGPPQSWDHGKDAQSYYRVTGWLDSTMKSNTAIGNAELRDSVESSSTVDSNTADSNAASSRTEGCGSAAPIPSNETLKTIANAFIIMGYGDNVDGAKKVSGAGGGWMAEDTAPGIVEDGRIWWGVKTFRVPDIHEVQISEEPNIGSESGAQAKVDTGQPKGGYRGRNRTKGNNRGKGNARGTNRGVGGASAERWAVTRGW